MIARRKKLTGTKIYIPLNSPAGATTIGIVYVPTSPFGVPQIPHSKDQLLRLSLENVFSFRSIVLGRPVLFRGDYPIGILYNIRRDRFIAMQFDLIGMRRA